MRLHEDIKVFEDAIKIIRQKLKTSKYKVTVKV